MAINGVKIIEKYEDYKNWDKLSQHCETIEELSGLEKEKAKWAFQFLRKELGDNFLCYAFASGHPIIRTISNLAPWTRKVITWFAESLEDLKHQDNYTGLLTRLKDSERFSEGLSVLNAAHKFSQAGFNISFDPTVNISGKEKIPDIKIIDKNTKEELFVEVSILGASQTSIAADRTMNCITWPLHTTFHRLHHCGRIHKVLSEKHLAEIVKLVMEKAEKAKSTSTFQEFTKEGVIEIGFAPESDKPILERWAIERGLKVGGFSGPPIDSNDISRTKGKIRTEQSQLPNTVPSILVLQAPDLFLFISDTSKLINELEEEVYKYPHILYVIIKGGHLGGGENCDTMKDQHVYTERTKFNMLVEKNILLLNRFCELKISDVTNSKIQQAIINC